MAWRVHPVVLLALSGVLSAFAQISPGPLSTAHQHLEGATKCVACHTLAVGAPTFKCASCHVEIRNRVLAKRGFHGRKVKLEGGARQECVHCHADHYGRNFNIVKWDTSAEEFDHRQAGYPLEGKHAGLKCGQCHTPSKMVERAGIQMKDLNRSYLGLTQQCSGCHADEHRGQLGKDCAACHKSMQGWKPATGFNHQSARYQLTGRHATLACAQCHKPLSPDVAGKVTTKFRDIPFAGCNDCHRDPHQGAFPGQCQNCHVTDGWKRIHMSSSFDHSRTRFALKGKHAQVDCFECHRSANFKEPVAHAVCADCHRKDDPHTGQFKEDCGACHTEQGYKPSTFDVSRHQESSYVLVGKHAAVACSKCHLPAGPKTVYRVRHELCLDCHKDIHGNQFAGEPHRNRCESCHNESGFHPSTYTLARHQQTRFKLSGGHAATACQECHKPPAGQIPPPPAQFHFDKPEECLTCHADPHRGQFAATASAKFTCESCHSNRSWKETRSFDHATTGFNLSGAHRSVNCIECHRPANLGTTIRTVSFQGVAKNCSGCHEDIHAGQFAVQGKQATDCASCHREVSWKPTTFDHEKRARFSLAGAHVEVPCADCHKQKVEVAGKVVVLYAKAPVECAVCHRPR